jgi:hypothetical protein
VRPRVEALGREALAVEVALDADPLRDACVRDVSIEGGELRIGLVLV